MKDILAIAARAAVSDSTILIEGESGVGKDLLANAIHYASERAHGPFVRIDCPNLNEDLLECELFGYEPGAFTDAKGSKQGKFELAKGGTLYIDGVDHLSITLQAKLLRPLQERIIERLGSSIQRRLDVRVIASTQRDLMEDVKTGTFRGDLFFRLQVIHLKIPPLRERPSDISLLATRLAAETAGRLTKASFQIADDALPLLEKYHWPGNVRELRNLIERLAITLPGPMADREAVLKGLPAGGETSHHQLLSLRQVESHYLQEALKQAHGNKSRAATLLGISRKSFYDRLKRDQVKHQ